MAKIGLEGMQFHAFHGYYTEEQSVGNLYTIDIIMETNIPMDILEDSLDKTINYEEIYQVCRIEMEEPRHLIETVAQAILEKLKLRFTSTQTITIRIRKKSPLLGGLVKSAFVELSI